MFELALELWRIGIISKLQILKILQVVQLHDLLELIFAQV